MEFAAAIDVSEDAEVAEANSGYWSAWHILTHDRQFGAMGGANRIPWASIESFAETAQFNDSFLLARMMWAMDEVFLPWLNEQQKTDDAD